jgi:glycosyltransferase involved in cell wall biosynthesis
LVRLIASDLLLEWQDPDAHDFPKACKFFRELEDQIHPDIVHLNSYREASLNWRARVLVVAHSCVHSWGLACNDYDWLSEPKWQRYRALVATGLDQADTWISPTDSHAEIMRRLYRPSARGLTIHNSIPKPTEKPNAKNSMIIAAGRMWDAAKNLSLLVQAGRDLNWPVFVAGTASTSAGTLCEGIELLGELSHSELMLRLKRAAVYVSPALYEPFGLSVLEAASSGCALVLSDIPTFRELWDGAAYFVPVNDASRLRTALNEICAEPQRRTALQRAAFARSRKYSLTRMVDDYSRVYRLLAQRVPVGLHDAQGAIA